MLKRMIKEVKKRALVFTDSLDFFFRKERDYNEENLKCHKKRKGDFLYKHLESRREKV